MRSRYGKQLTCAKCGKQAKYYRVKKRRSYECEHCGKQVYPTAGTPFENTRTPLIDWFLVMFMFSASRNGVSAKEVERTIGVTYISVSKKWLQTYLWEFKYRQNLRKEPHLMVGASFTGASPSNGGFETIAERS